MTPPPPPLSIPFTSIIPGKRARKDYGDLTGIKASLERVGSIHPVVLSKNPDNTYSLVAGGRRHRAMSELKITELFHGSVLDPSRLGFLFKDEVPEDELREAELDENLYRLKPRWQEDVQLVLDIHELKRAKLGSNKWGQRQTAALLGDGYGLSSVNHALWAAKAIRSGDKQVAECESLSDTISLRAARKEDQALAILTKMSMSGVEPGKPVDTSSFLDSFNLKGGEAHVAGKEKLSTSDVPPAVNVQSVTIGLQPGPVTTTEKARVPLSTLFTLGDCISLPWTSTHHIVTDIPYGIDMDNLNATAKIEGVRDEHEVEANVALMPQFLEKAFAHTLPHGFCVFFYDLDHHEKLQNWALDIGWRVQRWPLIWNKTHSCQNNAAQFNTTKDFEVAMILRKDEHTVLRSQQPTSIFTGDGSAERKLYANPFAKPYALWEWIYKMIAFPGQTVRDPFCGEMSACRAAANCGLIPYGNEVNEKHFHRGLENMRKVYAVIHKSHCEFV